MRSKRFSHRNWRFKIWLSKGPRRHNNKSQAVSRSFTLVYFKRHFGDTHLGTNLSWIWEFLKLLISSFASSFPSSSTWMALLPVATNLRGKPRDVGYISSVSRKVLCCCNLYWNLKYHNKRSHNSNRLISIIFLSKNVNGSYGNNMGERLDWIHVVKDRKSKVNYNLSLCMWLTTIFAHRRSDQNHHLNIY